MTICENCGTEMVKPPNYDDDDDDDEDVELYGGSGPQKVIILVCPQCHSVYFENVHRRR